MPDRLTNMFTARVCWVVLVLSLVATASAVAQKSPLVISGTVADVKIWGLLVPIPVDKDKMWTQPFPRYERKDTSFNVVVQLQYCNKGEVALIVPKSGTFQRGSTKILSLELPSSDSRVSTAISRSNDWGGVDPMPPFLKELEKAEPSPFSFAIVEPGTCHGSTDWISVKSGYKLVERPSGDKSKPPIEIAVAEFPYFKIQYSLSMKDSLPVSEAKRRWSHLGKLLTTSDGDFFFETDVIINKLPE